MGNEKYVKWIPILCDHQAERGTREWNILPGFTPIAELSSLYFFTLRQKCNNVAFPIPATHLSSLWVALEIQYQPRLALSTSLELSKETSISSLSSRFNARSSCELISDSLYINIPDFISCYNFCNVRTDCLLFLQKWRA